MFNWLNTVTNTHGVVYLRTSGISVNTDTVDLNAGFRRIPSMGYLTLHVADAIPEGTTGTLPVRLTLNGNSRNITFFGGTNVTAADIVGTGVIALFYNWFGDTLQIVSPLAPTA